MKSLVRWLALAFAFCAAAAAEENKTELLWLGQSCWRITLPDGKVIVTDPWLITNPKAPAQYKNLDAIGKVDLILVSHAHRDHIADAPALAKKNNARIWGPAGLQQSMVALGIVPEELAGRFNKGGTIEPFGPGSVKITATHAEHSSELLWKNPATGKVEVHDGSEPMGFIITLPDGFRIYHMGDTALFGDMKFIGEYYKPDLVLIPIGGHSVMDPNDAAYATREWLKPRYAIPMHYGTNPTLKGTPEEYIRALGDAPVNVMPISPGDKVEF